MSSTQDAETGFNLLQRVSSATRLGAALVFAAVFTAAVRLAVDWQTALLAGWLATSVVFLAWTWRAVWSLDAAATERLSRREDPSRAVSDALLVLVAVLALVCVAALIVAAGGGGHPVQLTLGVASVIGSWGVLHTVFTLKYARLYYVDRAGGIEFNQDEEPTYRDFAYVSFTVGMTFQVSDTNIENRAMRALVLGHSLLAYLFGAVILAVVVNLLASLSSGGG